MYSAYAPGLPLSGYYECSSCGHSATKMWWCKYCEKPMTKKYPKDNYSSYIFHFDDSSKAKIVKEVTL